MSAALTQVTQRVFFETFGSVCVHSGVLRNGQPHRGTDISCVCFDAGPRLDNNDLELLKLEPRLPALGEPAGTTTPDFIY